MFWRVAFCLEFASFLVFSSLTVHLFLLLVSMALAWRTYRKDPVIAGCFGVLALTILWGQLFVRYFAATTYRGDIFRAVFHHAQGPLYGYRQRPAAYVCAIAILAVVMAIWTCRRRRSRLALVGVQLLLIVAFSFADYAPRLTAAIHHQRRFADGFLFFAPDESILANYVERMSILSPLTAHHPPGNRILYRYFSIAGVKAIIVGASLLAGILLALDAQATFAVSVAATVFPLTCTDGLLMLFSAAALWAFRRDRGALAGLAIAGFTFFSFASPLLVLTLATYRRWRTLIVALGVAVAALWLLWLSSGYDSLECFRRSLRLNRELIGGDSFDHPIRYLFRGTGNFLGVFFAIGLPAGVATLRRRPPGVLAWIMIAFGGFYFLETERTLLFLVPALLPRDLDDDTRDLSLVLTATYALLWQPFPP